MTFASLISELQERDYQVRVYRSGERGDIEVWLAHHSVSVESRPLPAGGPDPFLEIIVGGEVVGTIATEAIDGLLEPPIRRHPEHDKVTSGYQVLFEIFDQTVFSAMNRRELLAVSREIEDRAFRVGNGILRVSFQTLSTFESRTEVYRTLGAETTLDIHIYDVEDWTPPAITGITYHTDEAVSVNSYWVLAFDGGSDVTQACGLVAKEHSDEYTGFWTNDASMAETIVAEFNLP